MKRRYGLAAAAVGVPLMVQIGPAATWLPWPTRVLAPRLRGIGRPQHVAITFDDGPDPASTPLFLEELERLGWRATFFLLGTMVRAAPGLARQIIDAGHEVGIHGDHHNSHLLMSPRAVHRDLAQAAGTITEATGVVPRWFRPPYGELSIGSIIAVRRLGLRTVLWSTWGRDWTAEASPGSVTDTVMDDLGRGGTILLHDSDCTSTPGAWRSTLGALPLLAERIGPSMDVGPLGEHFA